MFLTGQTSLSLSLTGQTSLSLCLHNENPRFLQLRYSDSQFVNRWGVSVAENATLLNLMWN